MSDAHVQNIARNTTAQVCAWCEEHEKSVRGVVVLLLTKDGRTFFASNLDRSLASNAMRVASSDVPLIIPNGAQPGGLV